MEINLTLEKFEIKIMPESKAEEIMQNVKMILLTPKFSVPLDRAFGLTANIVDAPLAARTKIIAEIAAAIAAFEPRAALKSVNLLADINGSLNPILTLDIAEDL